MAREWTVKQLMADGYNRKQATWLVESGRAQTTRAKAALTERKRENPPKEEAAKVSPPKRIRTPDTRPARRARAERLELMRAYAREQGYTVGPKRLHQWIVREYEEMEAAGVLQGSVAPDLVSASSSADS